MSSSTPVAVTSWAVGYSPWAESVESMEHVKTFVYDAVMVLLPAAQSIFKPQCRVSFGADPAPRISLSQHLQSLMKHPNGGIRAPNDIGSGIARPALRTSFLNCSLQKQKVQTLPAGL